MPKPCSICFHPKVAKINAAIISGASYRDISGRYGTSKSTLERHRPHIAKALAKATKAAAKRDQAIVEKQETAVAIREAVHAGTLLDRLFQVHRDTRDIFKEAREARDHTTALRAIARMEHQLELEARLLGELKDTAPPAPTIDLSRLSAEDLSSLEIVVERATIRPIPTADLPPSTRQGEKSNETIEEASREESHQPG
jgi:hypothetical protein